MSSPSRPPTIVALGGHEFTIGQGNPAIGEYLLSFVDEVVDRPSVCLLPTASGDPDEQIGAFTRFFGSRGAEPSHLSLFRLEGTAADLREKLLAQDLIYLGGGSMINLIAILKAHRVDEILNEAWQRGVVLCGQSAGAMCWFESGVTRSSGTATLTPGLGFLPGTLSVHYHRDSDRRRALLDAVAGDGTVGLGVDDQAGVRFLGPDPAETFSGRPGAGVWRVRREDGVARESAEAITRLRDRAVGVANPIAELREVRARTRY